ncbi:hypothetical protein L4C37_22045 [Vibrio kagoshimensis]|uniref:LEM-3-like GIY-YIG domain-containing protein n=1 Tax=Vibrio kagoshimensis TaxID=2910244 RepID=UPI003D25F35D
MKAFSKNVREKLEYYIYLYSDPDTGEVFYVGKGCGNRVFSHLKDSKESAKVNKLSELKKQNKSPHIEILLHGLKDEETAKKVESAIIDLIGVKNLTNSVRGFESTKVGRMSLEEVSALYDREQADITEPSLLIRINKQFRYEMSPFELYDATRGVWKVSEKRSKEVKYAFAVFNGIIQEIYEITQWFPAYTTLSTLPREWEPDGRREFVGNVASAAIRKKYYLKSVEHCFARTNQNPITYLNCNG